MCRCVLRASLLLAKRISANNTFVRNAAMGDVPVLGILYLVLFCLGGVTLTWRLLGHLAAYLRVWLGLALGLVLMMWLPALWAFACGFGLWAQWLALGTLLVGVGVCLCVAPRRKPLSMTRADTRFLLRAAMLVVPLLALSFFLQYTHILRPAADGSLHVGQSTFGDLSLHLGIATSLRNAPFPPGYSLLPGHLLAYPFLADSMCTSMVLLGTSLRWAFVVSGTLMMGMVYFGAMVLANQALKNPNAALLACVLFFLNGGLGFMRMLDGAVGDPSKFKDIFTGFYQTPANFPEFNQRWANIIADLLLPQRTLLAGYTVALPCLWLVLQGWQRLQANFQGQVECQAAVARRTGPFWEWNMDGFRALEKPKGMPGSFYWEWGLAALLMGALPLIHTHSFLAVGLCALGWLIFSLVRNRGRGKMLLYFSGLAAATLALALPQLFMWTFKQSSGEGFLRFSFNWVNSQNGKLIDGYFWFWIKNVGPVFLLIPFALMNTNQRLRGLFAGGLAIYIVAEAVLFQPNPYDNNKLFYIWYLLSCILVAGFLQWLWAKMKPIRGRYLLAALFILVSVASGSLSLVRETISDYELFQREDVEAAMYIEENAARDAVVLTASNHNNAVAALTGRNIVCGTGSYLYFHGLDYQEAMNHEISMLQAPESSLALFDAYKVDYAFISSYETGAEGGASLENFAALFPVVFENDRVTIFAVSARAQSVFAR